MYQRRVSYTYKYNNLTYTNTQATFASSVASPTSKPTPAETSTRASERSSA